MSYKFESQTSLVEEGDGRLWVKKEGISWVENGISLKKWHLFTWPSLTLTLVLQATPFAERGRVWSSCNYRVVAEERNYRT